MQLSLIGMMGAAVIAAPAIAAPNSVGRTGAGRHSRQPARIARRPRRDRLQRPAATPAGGPVLRRSQQREPQGADDAARHRRRRSRPDHREPAVPHEDRTGHEERAAGRSVPVAQASRRRDADDGVEGQALDGSMRRPASGAARAGRPVGVRWRVGAAGGTGQRRPAHRRPVHRQPAHRRRVTGGERTGARPRPPLPPRDQYSEKGADTCLECHDDVTPGYSGAAIFKGKHAHRNDKRAPFGPGGLQCEACHGPGARHARSKNPDSINSLKASSSQTAQERNQPCLGCHQAGARIGWHASTHERSGVACGDCHRVHQDRDPVLVKSSEPDVCFTCHRQKRGDFQKPSTHPVRFGLMGCSDCHSPHGSTTVAMLNKPTLNQTCFSCHADKRGPLLWEHAAGDRGLRALPHGARLGAQRAAHQDTAAAVPAMPCARRTIPRWHARANRCRAAPPAGPSFLSRAAAPTATRGCTAAITRQEPS